MVAMTATRAGTTTMRAFVHHEYGSPEVLELAELERPDVGEGEVLVRVHAASVNPVDWHGLTGTPYLVHLVGGLRRPRNPRIGGDFAGVVEAVGSAVTRFQPGDEVFGVRHGALAEYVTVAEDGAIAPKPENLSFEQAGAVGVAALTALQGLRDKGRARPGEQVLINGASGGVGTFAIQLAKAFGAEVTGVCSTGNVDTALALGADRVIDYTKEDFTRCGLRFDLMLDIAGGRSWRECKRVLAEGARVIVVGGPKTNRWLGSFSDLIKMRLAAIGSGRRVSFFIAKPNREDLTTLGELLEAGTLTPVIDRRYELEEVPAALAYLGEWHARGKIVITV